MNIKKANKSHFKTGSARNGPDMSIRETETAEVGDRMPDGTKFAGISPDTSEPMYALPADGPPSMMWEQAMEYAAGFEGHGHPKGAFRVPSKSELNVLFENKAKIGGFGFNETGSYSAGWYWSSTEYRDNAAYAWGESFADGNRDRYLKSNESSLRLVRS